MSTLKMYVRSIKAINTTVGRTSYAVAVSCSSYAINDIKAALIECGMMEVELAFVHLKDSTEGIKLIINANKRVTLLALSQYHLGPHCWMPLRL